MSLEVVMLDENQIREIVRDTVRDTVSEMFTRFGINTHEPLEVQKDFQHLNNWRKSSEAIKRQGLIVMCTVFFTGLMGLVAQHFWKSGT